jgi:hypothetical protein
MCFSHWALRTPRYANAEALRAINSPATPSPHFTQLFFRL